MTKMPEKAFILAAGMGSRLRPYTDHVPKPMVEVCGQRIIDRALDELSAFGVQQCGVNTHYKGEILEAHLRSRENGPEILFSCEEELLDTGGGIKKMLHHFEDDFFVLNGDAVWSADKGTPCALHQLAAAWDPEKMDILMALQSLDSMVLTQGVGDYDIDHKGRAIRSLDKTGAYMFTSLRINSPRIFDASPEGSFSYLELMDKAQERGRLYAIVHQGDWHHISTPADLESVNAALSEGAV